MATYKVEMILTAGDKVKVCVVTGYIQSGADLNCRFQSYCTLNGECCHWLYTECSWFVLRMARSLYNQW